MEMNYDKSAETHRITAENRDLRAILKTLFAADPDVRLAEHANAVEVAQLCENRKTMIEYLESETERRGAMIEDLTLNIESRDTIIGQLKSRVDSLNAVNNQLMTRFEDKTAEVQKWIDKHADLIHTSESYAQELTAAKLENKRLHEVIASMRVLNHTDVKDNVVVEADTSTSMPSVQTQSVQTNTQSIQTFLAERVLSIVPNESQMIGSEDSAMSEHVRTCIYRLECTASDKPSKRIDELIISTLVFAQTLGIILADMVKPLAKYLKEGSGMDYTLAVSNFVELFRWYRVLPKIEREPEVVLTASVTTETTPEVSTPEVSTPEVSTPEVSTPTVVTAPITEKVDAPAVVTVPTVKRSDLEKKFADMNILLALIDQYAVTYPNTPVVAYIFDTAKALGLDIAKYRSITTEHAVKLSYIRAQAYAIRDQTIQQMGLFDIARQNKIAQIKDAIRILDECIEVVSQWSDAATIEFRCASAFQRAITVLDPDEVTGYNNINAMPPFNTNKCVYLRSCLTAHLKNYCAE